MSVSKQYTQELKSNLDYSAAWFPNIPISLGDIGIMKGYQFNRIGNISRYNIHFDVKIGDKQIPEYRSKNAVTINTVISGKVLVDNIMVPVNKIGVTVKFTRDKALIFNAKESATEIIDDQIDLEKKIIELEESGEWKDDWVVITEVVKSRKTTIIVSNSSNAELHFLMKGKVGAYGVDLANINANVEIKKEASVDFKCFGEKLTPLFRAKKLNRGFWRGFDPKLESLRKMKPKIKQTEPMKLVDTDYIDFDKQISE